MTDPKPNLDATEAHRNPAEMSIPTQPQADSSVSDAAEESLPFEPPQASDELGRLGGYRILKLLGKGGMGAVYLAEDVKLHRKVALKLMLPRAAQSQVAKLRFEREAQAMAALESDHIVRVYQVGEDRGIPFIAMEYLKGKSLQAWMQKQKPTVPQILKIAREIALGLQVAHEAGLIHRDVKPANTWLEAPSGRVKILDFGLARAEDGDLQLTQSGVMLGTPLYMSPEQAQGEKLDHRTDLFSLGSVLYHLATGKRPFAGENTTSVAVNICTREPAAPIDLNPDLPLSLSQLIQHLLRKNPDDRPQTAREVAESLRRVNLQQQRPVAVALPVDAVPLKSATVWEGIDITEGDLSVAPTYPPRKRTPWLMLGSLFGGLAVLLVGLIIVIRSPDGKETTVEVPDGSNVKIDGKGKIDITLPSVNHKSADRIVAEKFLPHVDSLRIRTHDGITRTITSPTPLPSVPFDLLQINVGRAEGLPPDALTSWLLTHLQSLNEFEGWFDNTMKLDFTTQHLEKFVRSPLAKKMRILHARLFLSNQDVDLLAALPLLTELSVQITSTTPLERLKELRGVKRLSLGSLSPTFAYPDRVIDSLHAMQLQSLTLSGDRNVTYQSDFNRRLFDRPEPWNDLTELSLRKNFVDDLDLARISKLPQLKKLSLMENAAISDASMIGLSKFSKLLYLNLTQTNVTREGIEKLAAALPRCHITWDGGIIEPKSGPELERKAAEMLSPHVDLTLKFADGKTTHVTKGTPLPMGSFRVVEIHVDQTRLPAKFATETFLPAVGLMADLKELRMMRGKWAPLELTPDELERLSYSPSAESLTQLYVHSPLTIQSINSLKRFPKLSHLLCSAPKIDDELVKKLAELAQNLSQLQIDSFGTESEYPEQAISALMKLRIPNFGFGGSIHVNNRIVAQLAGNDWYRVLYLYRGQITDEAIHDLLRFKQPIRLMLDGNPITDKLLDGLSGMTNLTRLDVYGTKVTREGVEKFAAALPRCHITWDGGVIEPNSGAELERKAAEMLSPHADLTLKFADGKTTLVTKGMPLPIGSFRVVEIHVDQTRLPAKFATQTFLPAVELMAEFKAVRPVIGAWAPLELTPDELERLSYSPSAEGLTHLYVLSPLTVQSINSLKRFPKLGNLLCSAPKIDDELVKKLAELPKNLSQLQIHFFGSESEYPEQAISALMKLRIPNFGFGGSIHVNNRIVAQLAGNDCYRDLFLNQGQITDEAITDLLRFKQPIGLRLDGNPITDKLLDGLSGMTNLSGLNVRGTKVTREGVEKFAAALPRCRIVWDGGIFEPRVPVEPPKKSLNTPDRKVIEAFAGKFEFATILSSNGQRIKLKPTEPIPETAFELIELIIGAQPKLPDNFFHDAVLPHLKQLTKFEFWSDYSFRVRITASDLQEILDSPIHKSLQRFLGLHDLNRSTLQTFSRCPALWQLSAYFTNLDDDDLGLLNDFPALTSLTLKQLGESRSITETGLKRIASLRLTTLGIHCRKELVPGILREARSIRTLERVELYGVAISLSDLELIGKLTQIRLLLVPHTSLTDDAIPSLEKMTHLTHLNLIGTKVTAEGIKRLSNALPKCQIHWDGGVVEPRAKGEGK